MRCCELDFFLLTSGIIVKNRQDACSTRDEFSCGTGILPVSKQVIENGAISQLKRTAKTPRARRKRRERVYKFLRVRCASAHLQIRVVGISEISRGKAI
ncbi:hypothetical protein D0A37_14115 [Microcoleus vaginatus HSN003]|nr:hypothetical protein D0A37_14115 [Microcoleus vaginatus HSN003]